LVIDEHIVAIVVARILIAVELANLATLFHTEEIFAGTYARFLIKIEVGCLINAIGELGKLSSTIGVVDAGGPGHGGIYEDVCVERELHTGILGGTYVDQDIRIYVRGLGCGIVVEKVVGTTVEIFYRTAESIPEHEIDTDVCAGGFLPTEVGVSVAGGTITGHPLAIDIIVAT
jgi:hypothetical protein